MMTASEDESELLHRFSTKPKDQETARVLVERLKGWLLLRLRQQWPWLLANYEDIEANALLRLVRMRNDGELAHYETLERLARQLIDTEAVQEMRTEDQTASLHRALASLPPPRQSNPERQVMARELLNRVLVLIDGLPAQHALVLQALVAETTGNGPPMEQALGITRDVAQKRLKRARVVLLEAASDANLDEALSDFLESEG